MAFHNLNKRKGIQQFRLFKQKKGIPQFKQKKRHSTVQTKGKAFSSSNYSNKRKGIQTIHTKEKAFNSSNYSNKRKGIQWCKQKQRHSIIHTIQTIDIKEKAFDNSNNIIVHYSKYNYGHYFNKKQLFLQRLFAIRLKLTLPWNCSLSCGLNKKNWQRLCHRWAQNFFQNPLKILKIAYPLKWYGSPLSFFTLCQKLPTP